MREGHLYVCGSEIACLEFSKYVEVAAKRVKMWFVCVCACTGET